MKRSLLAAALLLALSGCAHLAVRTLPKLDLARYQHPFVVHLLSDGHGIDRAIAQALRARGYDADYGADTEMPDDADLEIDYDDNWSSDFTRYLYGLDIQVRAARIENVLAIGSYDKPSIFGRPTSVAATAVIDRLFPQKKPAFPPLPPRSDMPNLRH
ncbi:MAG: hypothetical protein ACREFX_04285 [Opitutaceae bacterium]